MEIPFFERIILLLITTSYLFHAAVAAESHTFNSSTTPASQNNGTSKSSNDILTRFQDAMGRINALALHHPRKNNYSPGAKTAPPSKLAPFLDADSVLQKTASNTTSNTTKRTLPIWKRFLSNNASSTGISPSGESETEALSPSLAHSYSIPPEILLAAKLAAESSSSRVKNLAFGTGEDDGDDYDGIVETMMTTSGFMTMSNDTNAMPQAMQGPDGLGMAYENAQGPNPMDVVSSGGKKVLKRAGGGTGGGFWMADLHRNDAGRGNGGGSFQTWRDIREFGAKGDGRTDDTEAIQQAIADGGRCSIDCAAKEVRPVTVYFPPGSYLISSTISLYPGTEVFGNPEEHPRLVAASSFVGGALIKSSAYTGTQAEWYLDTEDHPQSVRNLVIDVRKSSQKASIAGIHWRTYRGSLLDNIRFYATNPAMEPSTTQLGLYVENGSGGVLSQLAFIGGKYGFYTGTQQFTSSGLLFKNCQTALYVDRDWGLIMQKIIIDGCDTGVTIGRIDEDDEKMNLTAKTNSPAGSLVFSDMIISNGRVGINLTTSSPASGNLILLNSRLTNLQTAIHSSSADSSSAETLLPSSSNSNDILIPYWPPSLVSPESPSPPPPRPTPLTHYPSTSNSKLPQPPFFTRPRPSYASLGHSETFNVRAFGAAGDGRSDDAPVLNSILALAANLSAVVYIPQGIYRVGSTVRVPVGSRVVGRGWPRVVGMGNSLKAVVRVGEDGDVGVVEVQGLVVAVEGGTDSDAVLMEWNVREGREQGGTGLWDTQFDVEEGFKGLVMHITRKASAYLENVWTSKHVVGGASRGLLVESRGPTWLWGTSFEGAGLYQYGMAGAEQVLLGGALAVAATCSSQLDQLAPTDGGQAFLGDQEFAESPGVFGVIDSKSTYILGAAILQRASASSGQQQACKVTSTRQNRDLWIYSVAVVGESAPAKYNESSPALRPRQNSQRNGSAAAATTTSDTASFRALLVDTLAAQAANPYQLYEEADFAFSDLTKTCQSALLATINCEEYTKAWTGPEYHGVVGDSALTDSICAPTCAKSLASWVRSVDSSCGRSAFSDGSPPAILGNYIWYGWNETCQKEPGTGKYCNDVIAAFPSSQGVDNIPKTQLCSNCYLGRLQMMQASRYSAYGIDAFFQSALTNAVKTCGLKNQPTTSQPPVIPQKPSPGPYCVTNRFYTIKAGDNCTTIALANKVSSADLFNANNGASQASNMSTCTDLAPPGSTICLPLACTPYRLQPADDCDTASWRANVSDIRAYNTYIDSACSNLHSEPILGSVLCASPPGGRFTDPVPTNGSTGGPGLSPGASTGFGTDLVAPPSGSTVAKGTTTLCGKWYVAVKDIACDEVLTRNGIYMELFLAVNPSVKSAASCSKDLVPGAAYCVAPLRMWATPYTDAGCWKNSETGTVLGDMRMESKSMTVLKCADWCTMEQGYSVFGLSKGTNCFCDDALNKGSVKSNGCTTVCGGDGKVKCGGATDVSVFTTGAGVRVRSR